MAEVVSVSSAQGFRVHGEQEGSRARFESERTRVEVRVSCRDGQSAGQVEIKN